MKFNAFGTGIAKGLALTLRHLARRPITVQYPEQKLNTSRRIRGNELVWSREKCTGCATCAKTCPIGAIEIVTSVDLAKNGYTVEKYQIDTGYCIQCGLCVEACPYQALYMGADYEKAKYRRGELIQGKEDMLLESGKKKPSGFFYPEHAEMLPCQTLLIEKISEDNK